MPNGRTAALRAFSNRPIWAMLAFNPAKRADIALPGSTAALALGCEEPRTYRELLLRVESSPEPGPVSNWSQLLGMIR
jgi:hypothetical protein